MTQITEYNWDDQDILGCIIEDDCIKLLLNTKNIRTQPYIFLTREDTIESAKHYGLIMEVGFSK